MKRLTLYFFLLAAFASCVKETDWPLGSSPGRVIVVDAIVTDIQGSQSVLLTWSVDSLNEIPQPVAGANVLISNEDSSWQLAETPAFSGRYVTSDDFVAVPGKNYTLLISLDSKIYSAKTAMEAGKFFDPLEYVKNDDDSLYHIDWVASAFSEDNPAMWEVILDWSGVPGYEGLDTTLTQARLLFYTLPTLDVGQLFAPPVEKVSFPAGTLITENRYSLTSAHAGFIREMLLETSWQGGLFSSVPSNVTTNLSAGATGWFGACGKTSLSLVAIP
jgi:hypothetical protein